MGSPFYYSPVPYLAQVILTVTGVQIPAVSQFAARPQSPTWLFTFLTPRPLFVSRLDLSQRYGWFTKDLWDWLAQRM